MTSRALVSAAAAAGFGAALALALATPAWAHGGEAPDGTNYRTEISRVAVPLPGVSVRVVEAGARLELVNHGRQTIEVLGYEGEPYLEIRPDGVFENLNSPATYLNRSLRGGGEVPARAVPTAAPSWRRVSDEPRARWHDHRTHWMGANPPPQVAADPGHRHRVRDWTVPLRSSVTTVEIRGTLDWIPPPPTGIWWAAAVFGAALASALGLVPLAHRAAGAVRTALCALAVVGGLTAVGYAVAREFDAGSSGFGGVLLGLVTGQPWPVLAGLGAVAAGGYTLARRPAEDFALGLGGVCMALFAGVTNSAIFNRSVAPVPFAPSAARLAVAVVIATGAGLAVAASLRLRAAVHAR